MKKITSIVLFLSSFSFLIGCDKPNPNSDQIQQAQQERILAEGTASVGMPAIKNFREKRLLKDIYELRDQANLSTYTYIVAEQTGKLVLIGKSIGYGIPAATQFTSPQKPGELYASGSKHSYWAGFSLPQADPNGLFSPASAEGTWVMLVDPKDATHVVPVYIESRIIVSPFPLD